MQIRLDLQQRPELKRNPAVHALLRCTVMPFRTKPQPLAHVSAEESAATVIQHFRCDISRRMKP